MSPLIHWSPSSSNSLEDNPLAVPDGGHVADSIEAAAVCITRPGHIDDSEGGFYYQSSISLISTIKI